MKWRPMGADIIRLQDHRRRQLMLNADVVRSHARRGQNFGPRSDIGRKLALRAAGGIVDIAVEDIGRLNKGRVLRLRAELIRAYAVVENSEARTERGFPVAEHVVCDAHARPPIVVIGLRAAGRNANERSLRRGVVGLRQTALGGARKAAP